MKTFLLLLHIVIILGICAFGIKREKKELRHFLAAMVILRLVSGLVLGFVYLSFYDGGDTFSYFKDAHLVSGYITSDPSRYGRFLMADENAGALIGDVVNDVPRALFMVKITSIFSFISAGNYWISSLYFSLFAAASAWFFFKTVLAFGPGIKGAASLAVLFFPSVVFWGSGITKESVALGSLFILAAIFLKVMTRVKVSWMEWGISVLAFYLAWSLKYYWLAVFVPIVLTSVFLEHFTGSFVVKKPAWIVFIAWFFCFLILVTVVSTFRPNFNLDRLLHVIVENNQAYMKLSHDAGVIHFDLLEPTWSSMLMNAPAALFAAWFRPAVTEVNNVFQGAAALENLFILAAFLFALRNFKLLLTTSRKNLALAVVTYCIVLAIFLALSTPNLGTLVRYRTGFLPFLMLFILYGNPFVERLLKKFPHLVQ